MDYVIIIGHGAPGSIDAEGTSLCALPKGGREYSFDMLDDKVVHMGCLLYTCNGATPSPITGLSAAEEISRKTGNSMVQALYCAKTLWLANRFLIARRDQKRRADDDVSFWAPLFKMVQYHD